MRSYLQHRSGFCLELRCQTKRQCSSDLARYPDTTNRITSASVNTLPVIVVPSPGSRPPGGSASERLGTGGWHGEEGDGERWGGAGTPAGSLNEQIVVALGRLQEDMQSVLQRLHTLEALSATQVRGSPRVRGTTLVSGAPLVSSATRLDALHLCVACF
jgi:hypothetical protein